jgi:hypothetical protein
MNSASLRSLAGRYDKPIPPRFLAPIDFLKIPALYGLLFPFLSSFPGPPGAYIYQWAKLHPIAELHSTLLSYAAPCLSYAKLSLPRNGSDGIPRVPSIFVPQNGILIIFSSAEGSKRNSASSSLFCFTERFCVVFSSVKGFKTVPLAQFA